MNQLKFFILGLLLCVSVNTFAQDTFEMDTLQWTGPAENRVNFVILGDGYLESELDDFADELPTIVGNIFTQEPYKSYRNFFNIIAVNVISNETGAALDPSTLIDNYFGSTYNFAGIDRLLVPTKSNKVFNVLGRQFPSYDQIIVVVNHTKYGGSGGQLATSSINTSAPEITLHEIGHSFSGLIDEYWAGPQYAREGKNMTQETDENIVIWRNWMNELGIGIYDHNSDPSWKRPHQSCKMRYLGSDFCAVCKEATVEVIHDLVNTIDEYFPKDMVLDLKNEDSLAFEMDLVMPEPNSLSVEWFLNDDLVRLDDAKIKIGKEEFLAGENTLEAFVLDETVFSRIDDESNRLNMVKWTIDKSGSTSIQASASNLNYHLFPNPAGNQLNVNLKSTYKGDISASVYNVSGQLLLQQDFSNNKTNQVDVRTLPSGNYVFKLNIGPKQLSKKFIKK